jgi:hypothetical protein
MEVKTGNARLTTHRAQANPGIQAGGAVPAGANAAQANSPPGVQAVEIFAIAFPPGAIVVTSDTAST